MSQPYSYPTAAMGVFMLELILTLVAPNFKRLFMPKYGRRHRAMGAVYITILIVGLVDIAAIDARGVCVNACDVDDSLSSTDTAAVNEGHVGNRELPRADSVE